MQANLSYPNKSLLIHLKSALLMLVVLIGTVIFSILILMFSLLTMRLHFKIAALWCRFVLASTRIICGLSYQVTGLENLSHVENAIVLCKHQSAWETIALTAILPPQSILLKKSLLWLPFWGWAMATLKPIAIDRSSPRQALSQLLQTGALRLTEGFWIVIYPEGTRMAPNEAGKFSASGSLLAQRTGYPVIPIAHNAGEFWPRNSFLKQPGVIQLKIGAAITSKNRKSKEINQQAETWIKNAMLEIESLKK
jgi:1-acyl-sn-glycerol-3-phosphate acyltransferase